MPSQKGHDRPTSLVVCPPTSGRVVQSSAPAVRASTKVKSQSCSVSLVTQ